MYCRTGSFCPFAFFFFVKVSNVTRCGQHFIKVTCLCFSRVLLPELPRYYFEISHGFPILTVTTIYCPLDTGLKLTYIRRSHCVKGVCIRTYSGPHFPAFGLNKERYSVSLRIQSECGKMQTRITPNTDTFYAVSEYVMNVQFTSCVQGIIQIY